MFATMPPASASTCRSTISPDSLLMLMESAHFAQRLFVSRKFCNRQAERPAGQPREWHECNGLSGAAQRKRP